MCVSATFLGQGRIRQRGVQDSPATSLDNESNVLPLVKHLRSHHLTHRYHHTKSATSWTVATIKLDYETHNKNSCTIVYFLFDNSMNSSKALVVRSFHNRACRSRAYLVLSVDLTDETVFVIAGRVIPFTPIDRFNFPEIPHFHTLLSSVVWLLWVPVSVAHDFVSGCIVRVRSPGEWFVPQAPPCCPHTWKTWICLPIVECAWKSNEI